MSTRTIQLILSGALMATAAVALAETYMPIDFPGAIVTDASGINSTGEIVGTYTDAANVVHGFRLDNGEFSTIDYPGAINTTAIAVNARGDIAGFFLDSAKSLAWIRPVGWPLLRAGLPKRDHGHVHAWHRR
jgi:probable HAF family extracellular repeat protein